MIRLYTAAPATGMTYKVNCPPGMLAHGRRVRVFSSPNGFDAYVRYMREAGYPIAFTGPSNCTIGSRT